MEKCYMTFSKCQKEKKILSDEQIITKLNKIGIDYLIIKEINYFTNKVENLDLAGDDEITIKIKQALNEQGLSGIISI